jgi:erythromycin esterase-like protein
VTRRSSGHCLVAVAIGLAIGMITVGAGQVEATTRTRSPGKSNATPFLSVRSSRPQRPDRVLGASAHTANAPRLRIVRPADADLRYPTAGSHLRRWYGDLYRSIGVTFDHGAVSLGPDTVAEMPPPEPQWFEQPLGSVHLDQFALDLHHRAPRPVQTWLAGPLRTRGLADSGPGGYMAGDSSADWFDIVVHRQHVTAAEPA